MSFQNALPAPAFPGFTHKGVVADQVKEIVTVFNAESLDALNKVPPSSVAWVDRGSRVTEGTYEVKVPIRLPSSMAFKPFDGARSYGKLHIAAPIVRPMPWDLNHEWPMIIGQGETRLAEFYGAEGLAASYVEAGRAHKAQLGASAIYKGFTNAALGLTAEVLTIPQPGNPNGLPLFTDGSETESHYAHPFNKNSGRFNNLFYGAGKITDPGVFGNVMRNMSQVPHPTLPNMNLGLGVTDFIGPTHMLIPFYQMAIQNLALEVSGSEFAGTSNIYKQAQIEQAMQEGRFAGASGITPWRFWIAPQLDSHPYLVDDPGRHMWLAVSAADESQRWLEFAATSRDFTPIVTLFGDADPESRKTRMVRMISDLDAGVGAGLPHFAQLYFEDTPA